MDTETSHTDSTRESSADTERRNDGHGFATRAIHDAYHPADHHNALQPPVYMTSTYTFASAQDAEDAITGHETVYSRKHNPTTQLLEARLSSLEGAEDGLVVASGMAAFGTLTLTLLSQGDELIIHQTLYSNTLRMAVEGLPRFGIKVTSVDLSDPSNLDGVIGEKTKLVFFETPVNPTVEVLDIAAIVERAHAGGVRVAVDSTFASPALQSPIALGADIVMHSLTKYVSGHGDALGGAILGDAATIHDLRDRGLNYITGAASSPLNAHLFLRGLKTLPLRMKAHSESALAIANMLDAHPRVEWANHPFLEPGADVEVARRQMSGGSGMIAFGLHDGFEAARQVIDRVQLIRRGVSLGDAESLITHPAGLLTATVPPTERDVSMWDGDRFGSLLRLSVGLEDVADLIADLERALDGNF